MDGTDIMQRTMAEIPPRDPHKGDDWPRPMPEQAPAPPEPEIRPEPPGPDIGPPPDEIIPPPMQ